MSNVLYIKASPREERSHSVKTADAFIEAYKKHHAGDTITTLNLFDTDLPEFDGHKLNAKYAILYGQSHSEAEKAEWQAVEKIIDQFTSADKYVIALPMWNFSIPYRLKQYLDLIIQPTYTFSYDPDEGYSGLVTGKPVFIVYARGGEYPPGTESEAYDFQSKYLEFVLGFIGFSDFKRVFVEPTLADDDTLEAKVNAAVKEAEKMASTF